MRRHFSHFLGPAPILSRLAFYCFRLRSQLLTRLCPSIIEGID